MRSCKNHSSDSDSIFMYASFYGIVSFYNTAQRWQIGADASAGPTPWETILITVASSAGRVFIGIRIAAAPALSLGVAIR